MSIGVTGVSIAPELGIHFHSGSLSFFERLCCCCGSKSAQIETDDRIYIDSKLRAMRWQDKKQYNGEAATHARLKLIVVQRLHKFSERPFTDAETAFRMAHIEWQEPKSITRHDIEMLNSAVARIKQNILNDPLAH